MEVAYILCFIFAHTAFLHCWADLDDSILISHASCGNLKCNKSTYINIHSVWEVKVLCEMPRFSLSQNLKCDKSTYINIHSVWEVKVLCERVRFSLSQGLRISNWNSMLSVY